MSPAAQALLAKAAKKGKAGLKAQRKAVEELIRLGLAAPDGTVLKLTPAGRFAADQRDRTPPDA